MVPPTCTINGHPVPVQYGVQDLTVWAGPNRVQLEAQWLRTYGQAALDVTVAPGQTVPVFYAAPTNQFQTGSIGFEKQARKGTAALAITVGAIVVIGVLMFAQAFLF